MKDPVRVAVTGAAGQIGYSLLFRIASGSMLGSDQPVILQMLEIEPALGALAGVKMELDDCAFPLLAATVETSDANEAFKVLVVGNPANTNCLIAMNNAPNIADEQFTAMTRLDHNRAIAQLAEKTGASVNDITKMTIWGNHSATQYPDLFHCEVSGQNAAEMVNDQQWLESDFIPTVQQRGAAIIDARGASSAASAASAAVDHMRNWAGSTNEGDWVSMAIASTGDYGAPEGIITSFPCTTQNGQYEVVTGLELDAFSREKIEASWAELVEERDAVADMGLLG